MAGRPRKILVVEDTPNLRRLVAYLLGRAGYEVLQAEDGRAAVEVLKRHLPDLILLDIRMPGMDGFELLELLRGFPRAQAIPVVMLTSLSGARDLDRAMQLGVVDFLTKPIEPRALLTQVARIVGPPTG